MPYIAVSGPFKIFILRIVTGTICAKVSSLTWTPFKINNGDLVINQNTKHYLKMTNTIFGDEGLKGQNRTTGRNRATSFDLIVFKISEFWDEGLGFDYQDSE